MTDTVGPDEIDFAEHSPVYKQPPHLVIAKDVFAGTMAGIAQVFVGMPFDTVKVRMQRNCPIYPTYKVRIQNNENLWFLFFIKT